MTSGREQLIHRPLTIDFVNEHLLDLSQDQRYEHSIDVGHISADDSETHQTKSANESLAI
jgi:hypothetical protein